MSVLQVQQLGTHTAYGGENFSHILSQDDVTSHRKNFDYASLVSVGKNKFEYILDVSWIHIYYS